MSNNKGVSVSNGLTKTNRTKTNITKARKRDLIFEELCNQCGIDWKNATRNELGRVQKATKQLKEINAKVDDIVKVSEWYKTNWKDIDITPTGIVSNYSTILKRVEEKEIKNKPYNCEEQGHNFIDLDVIFYCQYCKMEKSKDDS